MIDEFVHSPMKAANFVRQCDRTYMFCTVALNLSLLSTCGVCVYVCSCSMLLCSRDPIDPAPMLWDPFDPFTSKWDPNDPACIYTYVYKYIYIYTCMYM